MMKNLNKKGMTLVEVILSIAIIGVISVSFLTIFTSGFNMISLAGNRSAAIFNNHAEIEASLNVLGSSTTTTLELILSDGVVIHVQGELEEYTQEIGNISSDITIFKPSR